MLEKLEKALEKCGLVEEIEEEIEVENVKDAFRIFATYFDIRPFLEALRKLELDTEGYREIFEELDVDTCEAEFVIFFLSDIYDELEDKKRIEEIFRGLKPINKALAGVALALLLYKATGSKEGVEKALDELIEKC